MPRRPKIRFNAQPKRPSSGKSGAQSKAAITSAQIGMREAKKNARENAEKTIKIPSPNGRDRNQLLADRGISVVRPEIIAATEFIPLVKDDDPSDATFTMTTRSRSATSTNRAASARSSTLPASTRPRSTRPQWSAPTSVG